VILAIPAGPSPKSERGFPPHDTGYVDGVIPFPLLKTFVVIKNPWWSEFPQPQQGLISYPLVKSITFPRKMARTAP